MTDARRSLMDKPMLQVDGISRAFGGVFAINDVSLAVAKGELRGVIGPNGAGKSTLFNLISGHLRPQSGSITLDGATCRPEGTSHPGGPRHRHRVPGRPHLPGNERSGKRDGGRARARHEWTVCRRAAPARAAGRRNGASKRPPTPPWSGSASATGQAVRRRICRSGNSGGCRSLARSRASPSCFCSTSRPPGCGPRNGKTCRS